MNDYTKLTCYFQSKDPELAVDIIIGELNQFDFESFEGTDNSVFAFIQKDKFSDLILKHLSAINYPVFLISGTSVEHIQSQNWNILWEKNFNPVFITNNCVIRAPFHDSFPKVKYDIVIEPKMSFGTGHHETTSLMIEEILKLNIANKVVLDMGCGTGILSVIASKCNAQVIDAVDYEDWAVQNACENCKLNSVNNIHVLKGTVQDVIKNKYDIILANINLNVILNDLPYYASILNPNGIIISSGFYMSDVDLITKIAEKAGLELIFTSAKNNWSVCVLKSK